MNVVISPTLKKEREFIDRQGNIINPRTKEIIQKKEEYIAPKVLPTQNVETKTELSLKEIKQMIQNTQARLAELEELKAKKVAELKAELEDL